MKIVNLQDFMKLPSGTIFSTYDTGAITGLFRKLDNVPSESGDPPADFYEQNLLGYTEYGSDKPGVDLTPCRWGAFDYEAEFAIYDAEDIAKLREALS